MKHKHSHQIYVPQHPVAPERCGDCQCVLPTDLYEAPVDRAPCTLWLCADCDMEHTSLKGKCMPCYLRAIDESVAVPPYR